MKKIAMMLFGAALLMLPAQVEAQTSQTASASVTVSDILEIAVTNTAINFGTITSEGYHPGDLTSIVDFSSNGTHTVQIAADGGYFTSSAGANDSTLVAGRMEWSKDGGGTWSAISTTAANIATSVAAGSYSDTVSYQMWINATDPKDTYSLSFTYSIIAG